MKHLLALAGSALAIAVPLSTQTWTQQTPATTPGPSGFAAAAPSQNGDVLLFGGWDTSSFIAHGDLWRWDGTNWTLQSPATANPPARWSAAMVLDTATGRVLLYGGIPFPPRANFGYPELWSWDGAAWTLRHPGSVPGGTSPSGVIAPAMCYDAARARTVAFGGRDLGSSPTGETWEWNDATASWSPGPTGGPAARYDAAIAFDAFRGVCVLFGGYDNSTYFDDTWQYDGTAWTRVVTDNAPPARGAAQLVFNPLLGALVLHGGYQGSVYYNDTWEFDGVDWYQVFPQTSPPSGAAENQGRVAALHMNTMTVVAYGGYANDHTWTYGGSTAKVMTYGRSCRGSVGYPEITPAPGSVPAIGSSFTLDVRDLGTNPASMLFTIGMGVATDLTRFGAPGCHLYANPAAFVAIPLPVTAGRATLHLPTIPAIPPGAVFECQLVQVDPPANALGASLSDAARGVIR
ncbi:MAG: hypothetical protein IPM29_04105 [Planctomycetes bacterium]|nr:hypothetical protein [Planctomycetota bacterium]